MTSHFQRKARMAAAPSRRQAGGMFDQAPQAQALNPNQAWQAVEARDRRWDGRIVYAVMTTGIYCRPSCPSRRPKRANVELFRTADEAAREGYRPCRRCGPEKSPEAATHADVAVLKAVTYLDDHRDETVTLDTLAEITGMSPTHLQRVFKEKRGVSPRAYQRARRLEAFKTQVREGGVLTAGYDAGFGSARGLYEEAKRGLGMAPSVYRKGGAGVRVTFTRGAWRGGRVLVAATEAGLCAVHLGKSDDEVLEALRAELPAADLVEDRRGLAAWRKAVVQHLEKGDDVGIPLHVEGTVFQRKVWEVLRTIPRGSTVTYGELATRVGGGTGPRAVASACARNRLAGVIPCHRVVGRDGDFRGYRWGITTKKALLEDEGRRRRDSNSRWVAPRRFSKPLP